MKNNLFYYATSELSQDASKMLLRSPYPSNIMSLVWAPPISLATTLGITFVFFSSGYLDVSVPRVPLIYLSIQYMIT